MGKLYSVVIPVYNSSGIVAETVRQVREYFLTAEESFEIVLVNDGSKDNSWSVICDLALKYSEIVSINLLKNYGQHSANLCGFRESKGDYVITMDDDLQNPPEEIGKLIDAVRDEYDLVIGKFEAKRHSIVRRMGSQFVGWLNRKVFDVGDDLVLTNFRIIRRDVVDRVCRDNSYAPYIPGLVLKYSGHRRNVLVRHQPRAEGKSNYTVRRILRLVASILFNHSVLPLRCCAALGFVISAVGFVLGFYFLIDAIANGTRAPGWASLAVLLSFFNGILILLLSVMGEYLGRILRELGAQRSYEVRETVRQ
ncbi:glycosyltransferase family 2 protein [Pandoraea terrigena]|uniref:Ribonuclease III n=1 Tax=Pandoraea terrigena TaxID=2508292 RepID=A0A5E4XUC4_9BURK|nr:glycosyltransferase family 2 protein [Pandoraea terrigena]VVE39672.1 ribonuclease III [Pandoraea terrigena]